MLRMPAAKVYLAPGATDMRAGIDRLSMTVQGALDLDPLLRTPLCLLQSQARRHQGAVLGPQRLLPLCRIRHNCLWHKRLEKHRFCWPERASEVMNITPQQLGWLLDGLTLTPQGAHRRLHYKSVI